MNPNNVNNKDSSQIFHYIKQGDQSRTVNVRGHIMISPIPSQARRGLSSNNDHHTQPKIFIGNGTNTYS